MEEAEFVRELGSFDEREPLPLSRLETASHTPRPANTARFIAHPTGHRVFKIYTQSHTNI